MPNVWNQHWQRQLLLATEEVVEVEEEVRTYILVLTQMSCSQSQRLEGSIKDCMPSPWALLLDMGKK